MPSRLNILFPLSFYHILVWCTSRIFWKCNLNKRCQRFIQAKRLTTWTEDDFFPANNSLPSTSTEGLSVSSRYVVLISVCLFIFLVFWISIGNQVTYMDQFLLIVCVQTCSPSFPRATAFHFVDSFIGWGRSLGFRKVCSSDTQMSLHFYYMQAARTNFSLSFVCRLAGRCSPEPRPSISSARLSDEEGPSVSSRYAVLCLHFCYIQAAWTNYVV